MKIEVLGILAGLFLAYSGVPQMVSVYRAGRADGITSGLIVSLMGGIGFLAAYVYMKHGLDLILHSEYVFTLTVWAITARYKFFPRQGA